MSSKWKQFKKVREWVETQKQTVDWFERIGSIIGFILVGFIFWGIAKLIQIIRYYV